MRLLIFLTIFTNLVLGNNFKNLQTFEGRFSQSIVNNSGDKILYNGMVYIISYPSSILWKYKNPIEKYVYISKKNVTIIEPELEQAIISKLQNELNLFEMLEKAKKVSNDLYKAELYNTIYTIKTENDKLKQIQYKDEIDNNITIKFRDVKQNQMIPIETFKYNIPYEYDIIRN